MKDLKLTKKHKIGKHGAIFLCGKTKDICAECHKEVKFKKKSINMDKEIRLKIPKPNKSF